MKITISHNREKHEIDVEDGQTVSDLCIALAIQTGVPVHQQKLIFKGKSLDASNKEPLCSVGIKKGSKLILMGKKHDPESDALQCILDKESKAVEQIKKQLEELEDATSKVSRGFLDNTENKELATKNLTKENFALSLSLEKVLERLDDMALTDRQGNIKAARRVIIESIQVTLLSKGSSTNKTLNAIVINGCRLCSKNLMTLKQRLQKHNRNKLLCKKYLTFENDICSKGCRSITLIRSVVRLNLRFTRLRSFENCGCFHLAPKLVNTL
eukprot:m.215274 g.215274  ORF g.215274 m.215274 type:complete len:270 (+) comp15876_c0_seq15:80-889(+)